MFSSGLAACASAHRAAPVSDLTVFREMYKFHKIITGKGMDQFINLDHEFLREKYPDL